MNHHPDTRLLGNLVQGSRQSAARRITQHMDVGAALQQCFDQAMERRRIRLDGGLETQAVAPRHDGHAMIAERTGDQNRIARLRPATRKFAPGGQQTDTGGRDEDAVTLAALDHLGIAGHHGHAGRACRPCHAVDDTRQVAQRKTLLEDECRRQPERLRPHHGDIVDRAVHRQATDIAAGKEQRRDHMAVRRHHQPALAWRRQHSPVIALGQPLVTEAARKKFVDQMRHRPATGAMRHFDPAILQIQRAGVITHPGNAHRCNGQRRHPPN